MERHEYGHRNVSSQRPEVIRVLNEDDVLLGRGKKD
jgi:hypothetical protein